jgi:phytoene dehydrogenase-like protein
MVVEGGMGVVTQQLATAAMQAGAHIHTGAAVQQIEVQDGRATGQCVLACFGTLATNASQLLNAALRLGHAASMSFLRCVFAKLMA